MSRLLREFSSVHQHAFSSSSEKISRQQVKAEPKQQVTSDAKLDACSPQPDLCATQPGQCAWNMRLCAPHVECAEAPASKLPTDKKTAPNALRALRVKGRLVAQRVKDRYQKERDRDGVVARSDSFSFQPPDGGSARVQAAPSTTLLTQVGEEYSAPVDLVNHVKFRHVDRPEATQVVFLDEGYSEARDCQEYSTPGTSRSQHIYGAAGARQPCQDVAEEELDAIHDVAPNAAAYSEVYHTKSERAVTSDAVLYEEVSRQEVPGLPRRPDPLYVVLPGTPHTSVRLPAPTPQHELNAKPGISESDGNAPQAPVRRESLEPAPHVPPVIYSIPKHSIASRSSAANELHGDRWTGCPVSNLAHSGAQLVGEARVVHKSTVRLRQAGHTPRAVRHRPISLHSYLDDAASCGSSSDGFQHVATKSVISIPEATAIDEPTSHESSAVYENVRAWPPVMPCSQRYRLVGRDGALRRRRHRKTSQNLAQTSTPQEPVYANAGYGSNERLLEQGLSSGTAAGEHQRHPYPDGDHCLSTAGTDDAKTRVIHVSAHHNTSYSAAGSVNTPENPEMPFGDGKPRPKSPASVLADYSKLLTSTASSKINFHGHSADQHDAKPEANRVKSKECEASDPYYETKNHKSSSCDPDKTEEQNTLYGELAWLAQACESLHVSIGALSRTLSTSQPCLKHKKSSTDIVLEYPYVSKEPCLADRSHGSSSESHGGSSRSSSGCSSASSVGVHSDLPVRGSHGRGGEPKTVVLSSSPLFGEEGRFSQASGTNGTERELARGAPRRATRPLSCTVDRYDTWNCQSVSSGIENGRLYSQKIPINGLNSDETRSTATGVVGSVRIRQPSAAQCSDNQENCEMHDDFDRPERFARQARSRGSYKSIVGGGISLQSSQSRVDSSDGDIVMLSRRHVFI